MCVFFFFSLFRYVTFFQCKCLFSFVSLFTFPPSTHECVCVCLYNFAFSHLFYNWGAASKNKKYKENIIFIVKTIHCMCVCFFCVSVCSVTKQARFMFRLSSALLQLLIIHSSSHSSFAWCSERNSKLLLVYCVYLNVTNTHVRARFIAIFLHHNVCILFR